MAHRERAVLRRRKIDETIPRIVDKMHRRSEPDACFICLSDLRTIWHDSQLYRDIIDDRLSNAQIEHIRRDMLPFVSFLVWICVEDWFDRFVSIVFEGGETPVTIFRLPMAEHHLQVTFELQPSQVTRWHEQFAFIPATVRFHDQDEGVQRIEDRLVRLPFDKRLDRKNQVVHGGYGKVEFFDIPPEYVDMDWGGLKFNPSPNNPSVAVAVKTFDFRDDAATREVRNLKLLKQSLTTNNSIALHLGLIDHASQYLIIFRRAMFGDLWQFIYCGNPPDDTERQHHAYTFKDRFPGAVKGLDITLALLEQCRDLALALKFLHTPRSIAGAMTFCAHMDLKPDNILIYDAGPSKPVGQWKICDFGISAFKEDEDEESAPSGSIGDLYSIATLRMRPNRYEGSYQPPEVDRQVAMIHMIPTGKDPRRIGRTGDIWSFGAIFAEVLSFAMERDTYVKEFREARVKDCSASPADDRFYSPVTRPRPSPTHLLPVPPAPTAAPTETEFQLRPAVATWLAKVAREASAPRHSIDCWAEAVMQMLEVNANERPKAPRLAEMVEHVYQHSLKANQSKEIVCEFVDPKIPKPNRPISIQPPPPGPASDPNSPPPKPPPKPEDEKEDENQRKLSPVTSPDLTEDLAVTPSRQWSEQSRRYSSPSSVLGKPFNAYGIKYNEDRRRRQSPPIPDDYAEVHKLHPPPRGANAVSVDSVFKDGLRAAYLLKDTVSIYCIEREGDAVPPTPTSIVLDKTSRCTWSGVALAGEYLAVWGKKKSDETTRLSLVRTSPRVDHLQTPPEHEMTSFDSSKRVAVSRMGFVALIRYRKVLILDLQTEPIALYERETPKTQQAFTDVAFNEEGDLLYAWATGSFTEPSGGLFVYRVTRLADDRLESKGYYKCDINEKIATRLFPYNSYLGCVIAANNRLFYPAVIRPSTLDDRARLPRHTSEAIENVTVKAACMYNNHSLVTLQRTNFSFDNIERHYRLVEYPLRFGAVHQLGDPVLICKLSVSPADGDEVRAVPHGGDILVFVVHVDGRYEVVRFTAIEGGAPARRDTAVAGGLCIEGVKV